LDAEKSEAVTTNTKELNLALIKTILIGEPMIPPNAVLALRGVLL
jgi:hypothetical protein